MVSKKPLIPIMPMPLPTTQPRFTAGDVVVTVDGLVGAIINSSYIGQTHVYQVSGGTRLYDQTELRYHVAQPAKQQFSVGDRVMANPANRQHPFVAVIEQVIPSNQHLGHTVIYRISGSGSPWDSDHLTLIQPGQTNTIADIDAAYQEGYQYRGSVANFRNPYTEQIEALNGADAPDSHWLKIYNLAVAFNTGHEQWKLEQKILKELRMLNKSPAKSRKTSGKSSTPKGETSSKRTKKATKRG